MDVIESKTTEMLISFKQNPALVPPLVINSDDVVTLKILVFRYLVTYSRNLISTTCTLDNSKFMLSEAIDKM